jgi:hypothetical protein
MVFLNQLEKTGEQLGKAVSASRDGGMDILDKLKQEHEEVDGLLKQLVATGTGAARKSLVKKIKAALIPHVRAEQKVVYDAIIALKNKDAKVDGNEGYIEHRLAEKVLLSLDKLGSGSPEFAASCKVLKELVEHHVEEEERNVWKDVRENFSDEQRVAMCKKFEAAKKKVRIPS